MNLSVLLTIAQRAGRSLGEESPRGELLSLAMLAVFIVTVGLFIANAA